MKICIVAILLLCALAWCVALVHDRGPICLFCETIPYPEVCNNVVQCKPSESCFTEHSLYDNGTEAFTFGCRAKQQCQDQVANEEMQFDIALCEECCNVDLCNNNICTNGTEPPSGIPCLTCSNIDSTTKCSSLSYCTEGQVCYTEISTESGDVVFNTACLEKQLQPPPRDCWDLRSVYNITQDGVYQVLSLSGQYEDVRCDMTTDGGGWTVFQKRYNGAVDFNQLYSTYASGFGNMSTEFWMGNDLLHQFTLYENQTLRVDLCDWDDVSGHAIYDFFAVASLSDCFRLRVAGYHGDIGDSLSNTSENGNLNHNMQCFSTFDMDNDSWTGHCGALYNAGWWFHSCYMANLNGGYPHSGSAGNGVQWRTWKEAYSFKATEMKFRPSSAAPATNAPFECPV